VTVIPVGPRLRVPHPASDTAAPDATAAIEALYDCARTMVQEPDALGLTRLLCTALARTFRSEYVLVAGVSDDAIVACTRLHHGELESAPTCSPAETAFLQWVQRRRQPFSSRSPETLADRDAPSPWPDVLAVPALHHQGHPVALLVVANRKGAGRFGRHDLRVLEAVAQHAAVAFDRAHLLAHLDRWARGLEALFKFSAAVSHERDPTRLVRDMAEHAACLLKADGGHGGLTVTTDDDLGTPVMESTAYWRDGTWTSRVRRWLPGVGIPGVVLDTEFPYLAASYATDAARIEPDDAPDIAYAIAVPIKNPQEQVLGFFELHRSDAKGAFTWQDAAFLESVANMTAVAIENARLGAALSVKNEEVRALSARHLSRLEEERQHIARELHDEAGQALVGVKLSLQAVGRLVPAEVPALREQLTHLREQVNEAATRLRVLARRLRPPTLDRLGLDMALQQLAQETAEHFGFRVALHLHWLQERLPEELETALFRVTQEALTNIAAHAGAQVAEISLTADAGRVTLLVADDGVGFDPGDRSAGLGLLGMRERITLLGGEFSVTSSLGTGTMIRAVVPLP
jgi:signal transduction histidine kinase